MEDPPIGMELKETRAHRLVLGPNGPHPHLSPSCPSRHAAGPRVSEAHRKVIDQITDSSGSGTRLLQVLSLRDICGGDRNTVRSCRGSRELSRGARTTGLTGLMKARRTNHKQQSQGTAMSHTHYLLAFFILLLVFLSPLVFLFFSSPPPSFEASPSFRFLSVELLTLTTVEFPRPALAIWFSAVVQSAESVSIAYLQWSRSAGGKDGTKVHVISLRIAEMSGTISSETRHALR